MKNIEKILKKERLCQALTGVSPEKIYESLPYFEIELEKHDKKEKKSSKGRKTELANSLEKLFFILYYVKCYPTFDEAGFFFGVDKGTANRWVHKYSKILESTLKAMMLLPARKPKKITDKLKKMKENNEEIFIDGTERPRRRPKNKDIQKENYSGKKKRHTVKNLVITNRKKEILYLSNTVQGSMHDFVLMKETLVKNYLPSEMKVYVDTGFLGFQKLSPNLNIFMPKKKPKSRNLFQYEKNQNRKISKLRILVEHAIGGIKRLRGITDVFRNIKRGFSDLIMNICCGLWNLNLKKF